MGIASMVIGIISAVLGFIPCCNYFALIPAIVGLIFGILDIIFKSKTNNKELGFGIAGTVLNGVAVVIIILWTMLFASASSKSYDFLNLLKNFPK